MRTRGCNVRYYKYISIRLKKNELRAFTLNQSISTYKNFHRCENGGNEVNKDFTAALSMLQLGLGLAIGGVRLGPWARPGSHSHLFLFLFLVFLFLVFFLRQMLANDINCNRQLRETVSTYEDQQNAIVKR